MTGPTEQPTEPEVLVRVTGYAGIITLNRPRAINALTHGMITVVHAALDAWADDDLVHHVVITGAGERGLCAGGDIVSLYRDATQGDGSDAAAFWADEYRLNRRIARYPKPYVAIQDGIVLGGGIGVSAHGSHRVVTERSKLGLPETGIGFVPDVGASWLLSRAPGELGAYLALTAETVQAGDAIAVGLADAYVPSDRVADLLTALEADDADLDVGQVIARFAQAPPTATLPGRRSWIDEAFASGDVADIVDRLAASDDKGAQAAGDAIATKSPTALAVALESVRRARALGSLEEALDQEYRVSLRTLRTPDFVEGVRAQVIDKDRDPAWQPSGLRDVAPAAVKAFFEPLGAAEPGVAELGLTTTSEGAFR
jgi:enoyl-CoA hydratase